MKYVLRSKVNEWNKEIIDEETGMTYGDLLEWQGYFNNVIIVEDVKNMKEENNELHD